MDKIKTPIGFLIQELTKKIPNKINNRHLILDNSLNGRNLKSIFEVTLNNEFDFIYKMVNKFTDIEIPKDVIIEEIEINNKCL